MASPHLITTLFLFSLFLLYPAAMEAAEDFNFATERKTHLHFYFHDIVGGSNPTAVRVVDGPSNGKNMFGAVVMIDDPLTEGPDASSSKLIGRAQGYYAFASQEEFGLLMTMNLAFSDGSAYNGSSLAVVGRNTVLADVREMAVVGGSGYFRLARGYALAHTYKLYPNGDAIVEYNVYVLHQ